MSKAPLVDIRMMKQLVRHQVIRKRKPLLIKGMSGIGKSQGIEQVVAEHDAILCDVRLSHYESVDLHGFPGINKATGFSQWHPMSTLPFIGNPAFDPEKLVVIFFDEVNHGKPEVLAVMYQIALDFRIGEFVFGPNVCIVMAMNGTEAKGYGHKLPSPLCDRLKWAELAFDQDAWYEHLASLGVPPVFIAFHRWKKGALINTFNPKEPEEVFATPRSWVSAIEDFTDDDMPMDVKMISMAGTIGEGPNNELWGYIAVWHKVPKTKDVVRDPLGTPIPDEESLKYGTAVSLSGDMNAKTTKAIHAYLTRMDPEYPILAWQLAIARDKKMYDLPEFVDFSQRYKVVFKR
jgi:hypothetical protein